MFDFKGLDYIIYILIATTLGTFVGIVLAAFGAGLWSLLIPVIGSVFGYFWARAYD